MKPMGNVFYNLDGLVRISDDEKPESICPENYLETMGDVIFEGEAQGAVHFGLRLRLLSTDADLLLRRKKEGDLIVPEASLGLDAKELIVLNESPAKTKTATVFDVGSMVGAKTGATVLDFFTPKKILSSKPLKEGIRSSY
jgi:hypothetical protein